MVFDGFLNLQKPLGWTSHDCVAKVRRLLQQKRVGHGGTLDPAASGVLPIALGKATRLLPYLPPHKTYRATILLGLVTATDDLEGAILPALDLASGPERRSPQSLSLAEIEAVLATFQGTISQIPPRYSAIQVAGQRLYDRARAGETFEVPARSVTIDHIEMRDWRSPSPSTQSRLATYPDLPLTELRELAVVVTCGPGTYIRAIARDLGAALGTGGTLAALERTESCGFTLATSLTLTDLASQVATQTFQPLPAKLALQHLSAIVLPPPLAKRWCQGQKLPILADNTLAAPTVDPASTGPISSPIPIPNAPILRVEDDRGEVLGVAEVRTHNPGTDPPPHAPALLVAKVVLVEPGTLTASGSVTDPPRPPIRPGGADNRTGGAGFGHDRPSGQPVVGESWLDGPP